MESLSLIAQLESDLAAKSLVMDSPFLPALTSRLVSSFRSIPDDDHTARLVEIQVRVGDRVN